MMAPIIVFARVFAFLGLALCGYAQANPATPKLPPSTQHADRLLIYPAKGKPNACGAGCDRWIAVEGSIDSASVLRVRWFLRDLKGDRRPIYFYSPGGSTRDAIAIGRMLRERRAVGRVGRTVVAACATGTQVDEACLKAKTSGAELDAEIVTRGAQCNSSCAYILMGAATREVAPDAAVAVHSSKMFVSFRSEPTPDQRAAIIARLEKEAAGQLAAFIRDMGIGSDLLTLIQSVKYESSHILTRAELDRFKIDTRAQAETAWTIERRRTPPSVGKFIVTRQADSRTFAPMQVQFFCERKNRARLSIIKTAIEGQATKTMSVMIGSNKRLAFNPTPVRRGLDEIWTAIVADDAIPALLGSNTLRIEENWTSPDGVSNPHAIDADAGGLGEAWAEIERSCSDSQPFTASQPAVPRFVGQSGMPGFSATANPFKDAKPRPR